MNLERTARDLILITAIAVGILPCNGEADTPRWNRLWPENGGRKVPLTMAYVLAGHPDRPNELLLGTRSGGIFKSSDGGKSWRHVSEEFKCSRGIGPNGASLAFAPSDPAIVYLGLEERGAWRSDDGGESWRECNANLPEGRARNGVSVVVHPDDPEIAWYGSDGGLFKTIDGGKSWKRLEKGLPAGKAKRSQDRHQTISGVLVHPDRPEEVLIGIYATGHDEAAGVFRSSDGGDSWKHVALDSATAEASANQLGLRDEMVMAIAADPIQSDRVAVATLGAGIWLSRDFGETWEKSSGSSSGGAITFSDAGLFTGGAGTLFRQVPGSDEWVDFAGNLHPTEEEKRNAKALTVKFKLPDGRVIDAQGRTTNHRDDILSLQYFPWMPGRIFALTGNGLFEWSQP